MNTSGITPDLLRNSVISVPPLARTASGAFNKEANQKIVKHLNDGGVTTLLYGGNAVLYHVALSEYADLLTQLTEISNDNNLVIPSAGPSYGMMMDQAEILRDYQFPTTMILPTRDVVTSEGVGRGFRKFVEKTERPAVLYIKTEGYIDVETVKGLVDDGLISCIKYAIVRENTTEDAFLSELVNVVDPSIIISGIGEQPAIVHLRDFGLTSFTSGCVCVAPRLSMNMLQAILSGDYETAEQIRTTFSTLEDLRNTINPIRVLHTALSLAGIADTGPITPLLSDIDESQLPAITSAASELLEANNTALTP